MTPVYTTHTMPPAPQLRLEIAKGTLRRKSAAARRECNLLVEIIEAKALPMEGRSCDPYTVIQLDHKEESRTHTVWNSTEPHWHHEVYLPMFPHNKQIDLVVWDDNENRRSKDVPLGKVTLTRDFLRGLRKQIEQWFPLASAATEGTVTGEVCLETTLIPSTGIDEPNTLIVNVVGGRDLVSKDKNGFSDPYVVLHLTPDSEATTTQHTNVQMKTLNPHFNQTFEFKFKGDADNFILHVSVWDWDRFTEDDFMGYFEVPLKGMPQRDAVEKWHPVWPQPAEMKGTSDGSSGDSKILSIFKPSKRSSKVGGKSGLPKEPDIIKSKNFVKAIQIFKQAHPAMSPKNARDKSLGSVRLKLRYLEEVVLPRDVYLDMIQLTSASRFLLPSLLGKFADNREDVARTLVKIFDDMGKAQEFLMDVITNEIDSTLDPNTIFRGNSMATKGLDVFMKSCAWEYLNTVLSPLVKEIMTSRKACEVDPTRVDKNESIEKNFKNLEGVVVSTIKTIFSSASSCPKPLGELFGHIRQQVLSKFSNNPTVSYTAISGFIFLRFFCPAILAPKLFGLWPDHADAKIGRTLTLVAKTIQNLGNLVEFGYKEEYMKGMNTIIVANIDGVKKYLDEITITPTPVSARELKRRTLNWDKAIEKGVDYERECSRLYTYYQVTKLRMKENATLEEKPLVERLESILDGVLTHYDREQNLLGPMTPHTAFARASGSSIGSGSDGDSGAKPLGLVAPVAPPKVPVPTAPKQQRTGSLRAVRPDYDTVDTNLPTLPNHSVMVGHASTFTMRPNSLILLDNLIGDLDSFTKHTLPPTASSKSSPGDGLVESSNPAPVPKAVPSVVSLASSSTPIKVTAPVPHQAVVAPPEPKPNALDQLDDLLSELAFAASTPSYTDEDYQASSAADTTDSLDAILEQAKDAAKRASMAASSASFQRSSQSGAPVSTITQKSDKDALDDLLDDFDNVALAAAVANEAELGQKCLYCEVDIDVEDTSVTYISWAGYKWHPDHFKCSVCDEKIHGSKFFFHDMKLFCDSDYASTFVCGSCNLSIHDEMIESFDKKWHANCFRCADCDVHLAQESVVMLDGEILCVHDYRFRLEMFCTLCEQAITSEYVTVDNKKYHAHCLSCKECHASLAGKEYTTVNNDIYCSHHFNCYVCKKRLTTQVVTALDRRYHVECFNCSRCNVPLVGPTGITFHVTNNHPVCKTCNEMLR